jgi:hypothetical protein
VQLTHLLEQHPKLRVVDRHGSDYVATHSVPSWRAIARAPLMRTNKDAAKLDELAGGSSRAFRSASRPGT